MSHIQKASGRTPFLSLDEPAFKVLRLEYIHLCLRCDASVCLQIRGVTNVLHANFEILSVVEEAYTLGIDLHDLRLFDDIPLMSHHAVDKGEAL